MSLTRTQQRHMGKAGYVAVKDTWLTPDQAAKVKAWDAENRAQALGKPATAQEDGQDT